MKILTKTDSDNNYATYHRGLFSIPHLQIMTKALSVLEKAAATPEDCVPCNLKSTS